MEMIEHQVIIDIIWQRTAGRDRPLIVALDGRSGSRKSTLAAALAPELSAVVVECDDFWPGGTDAEWVARTPAERVERVIDWRRLRAEALEPIATGCVATWHPFDFAIGHGLAPQLIPCRPAPVVVLDGSYSVRPELADLVGLAVLVELADDRARRARLLAREGRAFMAAWHELWDDAEDLYFGSIRPRSSFDLVVHNSINVRLLRHHDRSHLSL